MDVLNKRVLPVVSVAARRGLQRGQVTFDFVQQIAVRQDFDQFCMREFSVALAQRALYALILIRHGVPCGRQDFGDPVHLLTNDYTRIDNCWQ
jgi:hypothetical protein